jgi:uncharacterized protein (TIGR00304 family)
MPDWTFMITAGFFLLILGFFLVAAGIMRSESGSSDQEGKEKRLKGGGVIMIGPIPIVFGSDRRYAIIAMILAMVLMLLAIMLLK